jgi:hypothetical protein
MTSAKPLSLGDWFPSPPEYEHAPELAVLAILVSILESVSMVMLAANRGILDDDQRPYWRPLSPSTAAAEHILQHVDHLRRAVDAYRRIAAPTPEPGSPSGDEIPF